jgi:hypothetical protein
VSETPSGNWSAHIRMELGGKSPGESIWIPKAKLPNLPVEFNPTTWGTPLWLAHPGSIGQFRALPALHAYEMDDGWKVHRDQFDPVENPIGHVIFDAPEVVLGFIGAAIAGLLTWWVMDRRQRTKSDEDRNPWIPVAVAIFAAVVAGALLYILGAMVRVAVGPH